MSHAVTVPHFRGSLRLRDEPAPRGKPNGNHSLDDFRGRRLLLLFWNTDCGFRQRLLPDLREWEAEAGDTAALTLVLAAAGTPDAVLDVLDAEFTIEDPASRTPAALAVS